MEAWNQRLTDEQLERLNLRAKHVLSQLQVVLTSTYERRSVSDIARQLSCERRKVIWMQHVLGLRTARGTHRKGLGKHPRYLGAE